MKNKKFLMSLLAMLAVVFITFASCGKDKPTGEAPTSSPESIESVESVESSPESQEESIPDVIPEPTFSFSLRATTTSITVIVDENDPYNVGDITAIEFVDGNQTTEIEDLETRVFDGLYSGVKYGVNITYTYDIGDGLVSNTYSKTRFTVAVSAPTVEVVCNPITETSFSFDLNVTDKSEVFILTSITLLTEGGEKVESLDDLDQRVFEDVVSGRYKLKIGYEYDLNKGGEPIKASITADVSTVINPLSVPDFIVEVPVGRNPVILHISDTQIIDNTQVRAGDTAQSDYYAPNKMEDRLLGFLRETITATKPDLIIITGDLVYGKYDDKGTSLLALINAMDSYKIPWAPVFGNHDNESKKGVDWQCEQLEKSKYCLFKQRELSGNGNYTVGISQGGKLTRVFFMMDSNGCGGASAESLANGHTYSQVGFREDQVNWFMEVGTEIKELSPNTKVSFAFHIQIKQFKKAYEKYGFIDYNTKENPVSIDWHPDKEDGDFGYLGADLKSPWDQNNEVFNKMLSIGLDSIYVGHEHNNNASVVYQGVRYQFAQKISTYDRCNWLRNDGTILSAYPNPSGTKEIMGGAVNILDETGAIIDGYVYYCNGVDPTIPPLSYSV